MKNKTQLNNNNKDKGGAMRKIMLDAMSHVSDKHVDSCERDWVENMGGDKECIQSVKCAFLSIKNKIALYQNEKLDEFTADEDIYLKYILNMKNTTNDLENYQIKEWQERLTSSSGSSKVNAETAHFFIGMVDGKITNQNIGSFVNAKVDVNAVDPSFYNNNALIWGVANSCTKSVLAVLSINENINIKLNHKDNTLGNTALTLAITKGSQHSLGQMFSVIEKLVALGADINLPNNNGDTPIHIAILRRDIPVIELLKKNGADLQSENNDGKKPIDMLDIEFNNVKQYMSKNSGDCFTICTKEDWIYNKIQIASMVEFKKHKGTQQSQEININANQGILSSHTQDNNSFFRSKKIKNICDENETKNNKVGENTSCKCIIL